MFKRSVARAAQCRVSTQQRTFFNIFGKKEVEPKESNGIRHTEQRTIGYVPPKVPKI